MASIFRYGPYVWITGPGQPAMHPGDQHSWSFGPWPWYASVVSITVHPFSLQGADRTLSVTDITVRTTPGGDHFISCIVRNVGKDTANYAIWLGGVKS